jgi:hypothetical protein
MCVRRLYMSGPHRWAECEYGNALTFRALFLAITRTFCPFLLLSKHSALIFCFLSIKSPDAPSCTSVGNSVVTKVSPTLSSRSISAAGVIHKYTLLYLSVMHPVLLAYPADVIYLQLCTSQSCLCMIKIIQSIVYI